ncbi:MAG: hypothetical protein PHU21_15100 [Elusimicrobia bacterium]|nr:hypothetical protein [Elusimicrobiota bacterium]
MPRLDRVHSRRQFAVLAAFYAAFFLGRWGYQSWERPVRLQAAKSEYLHDEFVDLALTARDAALAGAWRSAPPVVTVTRQGRPVSTVAGLREVRLSPAGEGRWSGRWPCPWNAPPGEYRLELSSAAALGPRLAARPFRIARRTPQALPQGLAVLTLESDRPFTGLQVRAPDGRVKDWRGLVDWVEYVGADAFWVLGGRSPGEKPGEVWLSANLPVIPELARECRRRGIKFGVYAQFSLTMSGRTRLPGYEYALEVQDGRVVPTRAFSLREDKRVRDVADLLKRFRDIPGVDFLGVDYIRNALGGVELVDEFYRDMAGVVSPPAEFARLSREERMVYFARKKAMRKDMAFIDAWQWWRAHRVSGIIRRLKAELGASQPLWAFVLTWDKGWHHGQDAVMFNDAGIDVEALMLYEADAEQYSVLLSDWHRYLARGDAQVIVGDVVDWPLHQRSSDGPREFCRRLVRAVDGIYSDGPARGLFIHDLERALWGRLGPWSTRDWLDQARAAVRHLKSPRPRRFPS